MPETTASTLPMSRSGAAPPSRGISWRRRGPHPFGPLGAKVTAEPRDLALRSSLRWSRSQGLVCDIIYKGTEAQIQQCARPDGTVPLVQHNSGIGGPASSVPRVTTAVPSTPLCPGRSAGWFSSPRTLPSSCWPPTSSLLWTLAPTWGWTRGHRPCR